MNLWIQPLCWDVGTNSFIKNDEEMVVDSKLCLDMRNTNRSNRFWIIYL